MFSAVFLLFREKSKQEEHEKQGKFPRIRKLDPRSDKTGHFLLRSMPLSGNENRKYGTKKWGGGVRKKKPSNSGKQNRAGKNKRNSKIVKIRKEKKKPRKTVKTKNYKM